MAIMQGGSGIPLQLPPLVSQTGIAASPPFVPAANYTNTNIVSLAAGEVLHIPDGRWNVATGSYTWLQFKDPISRQWRSVSEFPSSQRLVYSDGANLRLANLSGCPVGAFVTTVGSGYTNSTVGSDGTLDTSSSPTVTISTGGSKWNVIVGGAVSGTVTITTAGAGYNYPPVLIVAPPPGGGLPATATCTVSAGAINAVTVVNNGAGYQSAPQITVVPDPRDTPTTTAVLTAALTGSGTVTGLVMTNHGTPVTSVPTFTFSSGAAAATMVMAFAATGFTVDNGGAVYGNAQPFLVTAAGGVVAGSAGTTGNPQISTKVFTPRTGFITGTSTSGGAVTATGAVVEDAGLFQRVPTGFVTAAGTAALPTTTAIVTITVGGVSDASFLQSI